MRDSRIRGDCPLAERAAMQPTSAASVDVSIAVLSWINDELRQRLIIREEPESIRSLYWQQQAVTVLAASLSGFCFFVLQTWT